MSDASNRFSKVLTPLRLFTKEKDYKNGVNENGVKRCYYDEKTEDLVFGIIESDGWLILDEDEKERWVDIIDPEDMENLVYV